MNTQYKSTTHKEKFFHEQFNHPKFKGVTIFAREEKEIEFADGWYASIAFCNNHDNFCRATGRNQARRRYFRDGKCFYLGKDAPKGETLHALAMDLLIEQV